MAFYGAGKPKDEAKGIASPGKAAEAGSVKACAMAFKICTQGHGQTARNPAKAEEWHRRAEALGATGIDWESTGRHMAMGTIVASMPEGGPPPAGAAEVFIKKPLKLPGKRG